MQISVAELLTWDECEPMMEEYCHELGIPSNSEDFVQHLQRLLTQTAESVDQICSDGKQVTISKDGEPVLKRIPAQEKPDGAAAILSSYFATPARAQCPGYPLQCRALAQLDTTFWSQVLFRTQNGAANGTLYSHNLWLRL